MPVHLFFKQAVFSGDTIWISLPAWVLLDVSSAAELERFPAHLPLCSYHHPFLEIAMAIEDLDYLSRFTHTSYLTLICWQIEKTESGENLDTSC